jgi:hypothetical protein
MPSPLEIEIALHYATKGDQFREGDFSAPAVNEVLYNMTQKDLLIASPNGAAGRYHYKATDGLKAYVERLCKVPTPERVYRWVFPDEGE